MCMLMDREADSEIQCDMDVRPGTERPCNEGECKPEDFDIGVIIKNTVVGISHWRIGPWSAVSYNFTIYDERMPLRGNTL